MTEGIGAAVVMPRPTGLPAEPAPAADDDERPALLGAAEIEFELRRLIARLIEGSRLLHGVRSRGIPAGGGRPGMDRPGVLLDLEVNGVRCLLTWRLNSSSGAAGRLTMREREVANMVAMGMTNSAIAATLDVSPWTVSTHLRRIFAKLDVPTRAAMVAVIADALSSTAPETGENPDPAK